MIISGQQRKYKGQGHGYLLTEAHSPVYTTLFYKKKSKVKFLLEKSVGQETLDQILSTQHSKLVKCAKHKGSGTLNIAKCL